jgi:hypothetical protein
VAVVVTQSNVTFYMDGYEQSSAPLERPVTDCSGKALEIGDSNILQLGEVTFFARAVTEVEMREIMFAGFTLQVSLHSNANDYSVFRYPLEPLPPFIHSCTSSHTGGAPVHLEFSPILSLLSCRTQAIASGKQTFTPEQTRFDTAATSNAESFAAGQSERASAATELAVRLHM